MNPSPLKTVTVSPGSLTAALKAQNLLADGGVPSAVVRLSPETTPNGCSYGLTVEPRRLMSALVILKNAGLSGQVLP